MNLAQLLAAAKAARESMSALMTTANARPDGEREFTTEEAEAFDKLEKGLNATMANITRVQNFEAAQAAASESAGSIGRNLPAGGPTRVPGAEASTKFETFGEFMAAVRFNPNDQRLLFAQRSEAEQEAFASRAAEMTPEMRAEMRMDVGTQGGFMVPTEFRTDILSVKPEEVIVRPRATVFGPGQSPDAPLGMPILNQSAGSNMFGGMTFQWIGEGDEKPETDADLGEMQLTPHEIAGIVVVTDKLLRNWSGAENWLKNMMRESINAIEDYTFIRGDGVAKPLGILNAPGALSVNRAVANQIAYADVVAMVAKFLMRGGNPMWLASQGTIVQFANLKDSANNLIWVANAREGFAGTLLGYPLKLNNRLPALGTRGDLILVDWSFYYIKDGSGPFVAMSEHVKFTSNKTVIKAFWNVDGQLWLPAPVTEENGYTVSPVVILDVPA